MFGPIESLPSVLGAHPPQENNATLETKGYEVSISWKDRIGSDFSYNARMILGDSKTKVIKYSNPTKILSNWYEGQMVGEIWGYETVGFFEDDADVDAHADQSAFHTRWQAGDIKYRDLNNDGVINWGDNTLDSHGDLKVIGNSMPRYNYGLAVGFNWKGVDFNMHWQGVGKKDVIFNSNTNVFWGFRGNKRHNSYFEEHMDYWSPEGSDFGGGPDAYFPRPYIVSEHQKNTKVQSKYLQSAAYVRLKNLQIGYTVPDRVSRKVRIERLRIYLSGENMVTFTKLSKNFDPETTGGLFGAGKIYPLQKAISMGLNISF